MSKVIINDNIINYKLTRKKVKNIILKITVKGELLVTAPYNVNVTYINDVLLNRLEWITNNTRKMQDKSLNSYISNDFRKIKYLGGEYLVEISSKSSIKKIDIRIEGIKCLINIRPEIYKENCNRELIKIGLINWYKERAKELFLNKTIFYSNILGVSYNNIRIKNQKTLWGSCSSKNNINYNIRLMLAPVDIIDYIVVHEVCHLKHKNHSKQFWDEVNTLMPNYLEKKQWLKSNGYTLILK